MSTSNSTIAPRRPGDTIRSYEVLDQLSRPVDAGQSQVYLVRRRSSGQLPRDEVIAAIKSGQVDPRFIEEQQVCVLKLAMPNWEDNLRLEYGYLLRFTSGGPLIELSGGFGPSSDPSRSGRRSYGEADLLDNAGARMTLPYILTAFYPGGSLLHLLNREQRRPLPARFAVEVARQVAEALLLLQNYDIVHHDISPHNIVFRRPLDTPSETPDCVLIDFAAAAEPRAPRPIRSAGKQHYLPPQRLDQRAPLELSWRIDLYGLGVVLYEMLAGELPRRTDATGKMRPLPSITEHRQDLSPALAALVNRTVSHDMRQWPASIQAFRDALDSLPERRPAPAPPRPSWRIWASLGAGAAALLLGAALAFGASSPPAPASTPATVEPTIALPTTRVPPTSTPTTVPTSTPGR